MTTTTILLLAVALLSPALFIISFGAGFYIGTKVKGSPAAPTIVVSDVREAKRAVEVMEPPAPEDYAADQRRREEYEMLCRRAHEEFGLDLEELATGRPVYDE